MNSNNNFSIKIHKIVKSFANYGKIWNIDTNLLSTWKRFNDSIVQTNIEKNSICSIVLKFHYQKRNLNGITNYWKLYIKNSNNELYEIYPYVRNGKDSWSDSGARQFIQEGNTLNIFENVSKIGKITTKNPDKEIEFLITRPILENLINEDNNEFKKNIFKLTFDSVMQINKTFRSFVTNLGFSLFLCSLQIYLDKNWDVKKELKKITEYDKICIKKVNNKMNKQSFYFLDPEYISYIEKVNKETYKDFSAKFSEQKTFEKIIEALINSIEDPNDEGITWQEIISEKQEQLFQNIYKKIVDKRNQVRENLNAKRSKNNLINDIQGLVISKYHQKDSEAAHIYNVKQAKQKIFDEINNFEIKDIKQLEDNEIIQLELNTISNINNVIWMPTNLHKLFDDNVITFDNDGKMIVTENFREEMKENKELETRLEFLKALCLDGKIENVRINMDNFDSKQYLDFITKRV